jgi:hypothetical protein
LGGISCLAARQLLTFSEDYRLYKERNEATSMGMRMEFWQKSLQFFAEAPVIGHGTGSTRGLFEKAATGPQYLLRPSNWESPQSDVKRGNPVGRGWKSSYCTRCGRVICCCFVATGWWTSVGMLVVVQNISRHCLIRICSISMKMDVRARRGRRGRDGVEEIIL